MSDFRHALETALDALPPRIAQAFAMYEMEERAGTEVYRQMDISPSNLWMMLHRARKQLRQLLSRWRDEVNDSSGAC